MMITGTFASSVALELPQDVHASAAGHADVRGGTGPTAHREHHHLHCVDAGIGVFPFSPGCRRHCGALVVISNDDVHVSASIRVSLLQLFVRAALRTRKVRCGSRRVTPCAASRLPDRCLWTVELFRAPPIAPRSPPVPTIAVRSPGRARDAGVLPHHLAHAISGHLLRAIHELRNRPLLHRRSLLQRCHTSRSRATRSAKASPSSNEFDASRFAPCTPVRATSPRRRVSACWSDHSNRHHAAHHIVGGWCHGMRSLRGSMPRAAQSAKMPGKRLAKPRPSLRASR